MHILLVESDDLIAKTTAYLLMGLGHQVVTCTSAKESMGWLERDHISAVVVDREAWACREFVGTVPRHRLGLTVVLVGSYWSRSEKEEAMRMGAAGVLTKPFQLEELTDLLPRP